MKKHQTTFRFDEKEQEAMRMIREYYGVSSDIDAIRIALQETVRTISKPITPPHCFRARGEKGRAIHPPRE